jgi:hypothetical protein
VWARCSSLTWCALVCPSPLSRCRLRLQQRRRVLDIVSARTPNTRCDWPDLEKVGPLTSWLPRISERHGTNDMDDARRVYPSSPTPKCRSNHLIPRSLGLVMQWLSMAQPATCNLHQAMQHATCNCERHFARRACSLAAADFACSVGPSLPPSAYQHPDLFPRCQLTRRLHFASESGDEAPVALFPSTSWIGTRPSAVTTPFVLSLTVTTPLVPSLTVPMVMSSLL